MMARWITLGLLLVLGIVPLVAQDLPVDDFPLDVPISFDNLEGDTITDRALYDWWNLDLKEGDTIHVEMQAFEGLVPLLGILDSNRDVIARSDTDGVAEANATITLDFRASVADQYRIITSRAGGVDGTSTGIYTVMVSLVSMIPPRENFLPQVQFRCGDMILTNVLTLSFAEDVASPPGKPADAPYEQYIVTAAGYDTFEPALRATSDTLAANLDCTRSGTNVPGAQFIMPAETALTVPDEQHSVQLTAIGSTPDVALGDVNFTLASVDPTTGRFVMMLEGLSVMNRIAPDMVVLRLGPRARTSVLKVYMISDKNSRLDPFIGAVDADGTQLAICDDAGLLQCTDVPSARDLQVIAPNGSIVVQGGRFDAGLILRPNGTDPIGLQLGSKGNETTGAYTLVIVGELE